MWKNGSDVETTSMDPWKKGFDELMELTIRRQLAGFPPTRKTPLAMTLQHGTECNEAARRAPTVCRINKILLSSHSNNGMPMFRIQSNIVTLHMQHHARINVANIAKSLLDNAHNWATREATTKTLKTLNTHRD